MRWMAVVVAVASSACATVEVDDADEREQQRQADAAIERACSQAETCGCELTAAAAPCETVLADTWRARLVAGRERGLTWDGSCAEGITDAIDSAGCTRPLAGEAHPCSTFCQVFHGEGELGSRCTGLDTLVSDCAQGLLCDRGRCVEPCTRLSGRLEGEVCRQNGVELDRCADGLVCSFASDRCIAPLPFGTPCNTNDECGRDGYCAWNETPEVCRPAAGEGASCEYVDCAADLDCRYQDATGTAVCLGRANAGEPCGDRRCADPLSCDVTNRCRAPSVAGEYCIEVPCAEGLLCDATTDYRCTAPPPIGAPCAQGECEAGARCDSVVPDAPVCRAALADGEACSGHAQCASRFCPAGACEPRPQLGEDCSEALVCAMGLGCDGAVCRNSATNGPAVCVYDGW